MIRCPKCDKELPEDSKFCKACGAKILTAEEKQKSTKKKIIAIIAVLLAIIIGLSGFIIFDKINNKPDVTKATTESQVLNNNPAKPNDNNTNNNPSDEDIYKAPDGKYYIPVRCNYKSIESYDPDTDTTTYGTGVYDFQWSADSVVTDKSTYKFNKDGQMTEYFYIDLMDRNIEVNYVYSGMRLSEIVIPDENRKTVFSYDDNGNIVRLERYYGTEIATTKNCVYDAQNRLIKTSVVGDDDDFYYKYIDDKTVNVSAYEGHPDYISITFYFNDNNQIMKVIPNDDVGTELVCEYDENNNLKTINISSERGEEYFEIIWEEGTKEKAIFAKDNMHLFTKSYLPYYLKNENLMEIMG